MVKNVVSKIYILHADKSQPENSILYMKLDFV